MPALDLAPLPAMDHWRHQDGGRCNRDPPRLPPLLLGPPASTDAPWHTRRSEGASAVTALHYTALHSTVQARLIAPLCLPVHLYISPLAQLTPSSA